MNHRHSIEENFGFSGGFEETKNRYLKQQMVNFRLHNGGFVCANKKRLFPSLLLMFERQLATLAYRENNEFNVRVESLLKLLNSKENNFEEAPDTVSDLLYSCFAGSLQAFVGVTVPEFYACGPLDLKKDRTYLVAKILGKQTDLIVGACHTVKNDIDEAINFSVLIEF